MKKIILIAALILAVWNYFEEQKPTPENRSGLLSYFVQSVQGTVVQKKPEFQCDGRLYCPQMKSRAEAEFFLEFCPGTYLDDNNNGIPCENDPRF
ncbi:excalibur calcium-binding domain-containing protein [Pseudidiomarina marina]|uniref:Calcium-binding protein n=1 Tax=Pseudidiomarina marina TaxID=502366 RepID=A0A432YJ50_9GAMM|nr:excalibur calcium-binding domain-containing protein [Pseudidiomarina marina]PHR65875.1 MAG: calcium-binding protein [Idiomarina sp.]RUO60946.1 calcium-binding protein [Pseudidiomarina marina]